MSRKRVAVEVVPEEPSKVAPFVAYQPVDPWLFRSFDPKQDVSQYEVYERWTNPHRPDFALVGSAKGFKRQDMSNKDQPGAFLYVGGKPATSEYHGIQSTSVAVGVFNRKTQTLQLLPVAGNRVHRMEAIMDTVDYSMSKEGGSEVSDYQTDLLKRRQLVDSFGSTRRMRQIQNMAEGRVVGRESQAAVIDQSRQDAQNSMMSRSQLKDVTAEARQLPPHHLEAKTPDQAYVLNELVPPAALMALDHTKLLAAASSPDLLEKMKRWKQIPAYVESRLPALLSTGDHKGKILDFLAALIILYQSPQRLDARHRKSDIPMRSALLAPLLKEYYTEEKDDLSGHPCHQRSFASRDRLCLTILVVALMFEDWIMQVEQFEALRKLMCMATPDLLLRFRELGCKCAVSTQQVVGDEGNPQTLRGYSISLLQGKDALAGKTLGECLPEVRGKRTMMRK